MKSDEQYIKERKFFFRFLKEKGLFSAFFRYIHNPKTYNLQRLHDYFSFESHAKKYGFQYIISSLILWNKTKEGESFWCHVCEEFAKRYELKFE